MKTETNHSRPTVNIYVDSSHDYGRSLMRGILKYANLNRHWITHIDWWDASKKHSIYPDCHGSLVAGIKPHDLQPIRDTSHHLVNCSTADLRDDTPSVHVDNTLTGELAAKHLLDCNLKHFAYYPATAAESGSPFVSRFQGFKDTLKRRGHDCAMAPTQWPQEREWLLQHHHKEVAAWIASLPKPVGIMASDDVVAYDLLLCCKKMGVSVPDEVAVIGVNNDELMCEGAWPPLSSVHVDFSRVGFRAAQLLDRLLKGESMPKSKRDVSLPPLGVVQRASTNILAVSDPLLADAIHYMREHACDPCNVQDVLQHVPIARRKLEKLLVITLGRTHHQEILRIRIETAVRMLIETDFPIIQIAHQSGFSAIQNFNKTFRTHLNQTPAAYRRAARQA